MSFENDADAFVLGTVYNFNPPQKCRGRRQTRQDPGKYEPDHDETGTTRTMVLASWVDGTNVLVKYDPRFWR